MGLIKITITSLEILKTALAVATARLLIVVSPNIPFDDATAEAIPIASADLVVKENESNDAHLEVHNADVAIDAKVEELRKYEDSIYIVVNLKIKDGIYDKSIRLSFGQTLEDSSHPYNDSEIAVELLVPKILTGIAKLAELGKPPMVDYNGAHCTLLLGEIATLKGVKIAKENISEAKDIALHLAYETYKPLFEFAEQQAETFYHLKKDGDLRDAMRDWGSVYEEEKVPTKIAIKSKMIGTGLAPAVVTWHIGKALTARGKVAIGGVSRTSEAHAEVVLPTVQEGALILTGTSPGCIKIVAPITVVPGEDQSLTFTFSPLPPEE